MQRRVITVMALFFSALLLLGGVLAAKDAGGDDNPRADDPTTTLASAPPTTCINGVHFWAQDVFNDNWGPDPGTRDPQALIAELRNRRVTDPVRTVYDTAYQNRMAQAYPDRQTGTQLAVNLINDQAGWCDQIARLEAKEATATSVTVHEMCGPYLSLGMKDQDRQIPEVYVVHPNKCFDVLDFSYADGSHDWYKIDCGLQPVDKTFTGVPPKEVVKKPIPQPKPVPTTVPKPPTTVTAPPTTAPPAPTTVPPSPTTTWKCDGKWHYVGGVKVCGTGGDVGTPPYQPPSSLPPTPGYNPATTVPGSTIPPGATPPVSFAPTPPYEAPVATDPPSQGDPCDRDPKPAYC